MRNDIGPICCFKKCMILKMLPKTRSGKCLRNVLKGMVRKRVSNTDFLTRVVLGWLSRGEEN